MSYRTGQMGVAEGLSLVFMITFFFIFLTTPAQAVEAGAGLAWLISLVRGLPPMIMLLAMTYVMCKYPGDMYSICHTLLGRVGAWGIALYYISVFLCNCVLLLRQFAENTLLTALPNIEFSMVVLIYMGVAAVIAYIGLEGMVRTNYIIMPFAILALISVLLLLAPFYNSYHLQPWQGTGLENVIPASFILSGAEVSSFALIILAPAFQNLRTIRQAAIFGLGLSTLLETATVLVFTLVFDVQPAREKVLPFFEMARLVYLSRYLQRIESLFIILWVMAGVLAVAANLFMGVYLITRLLNLPTMRPLLPLVAIILAELAMLPPDVTSVIIFDSLAIRTYFNIGVYVIPAILIAAAFLKKKRRVAKC